jgi:hypothetical protein
MADRIHVIGKRLPKVITTGLKLPRISPSIISEALNAEKVNVSDPGSAVQSASDESTKSVPADLSHR